MLKLSTARNFHSRMQKISYDFLPFLRDYVCAVSMPIDKIAACLRRGAVFGWLNTSKTGGETSLTASPTTTSQVLLDLKMTFSGPQRLLLDLKVTISFPNSCVFPCIYF